MSKKKAEIFRMVTPDHLCPWGVKARDLLGRNGYEVSDHHLTSKRANSEYKKQHGYDETPQIFIEGRHVGGYDALRKRLGMGPDPKEGVSYQPVVAVFAVTLLMAMAVCHAMQGQWSVERFLELFVAFSMCVLGILKLRDLQAFATDFVQYDLIARQYVPYAYLYAVVETGAGILMIAELVVWLAAPAAFIVSFVSAVSVIKAVYLEKRELNCACVGGGSSVPLGAVSLTENLMMMAMAVWMIGKMLW